MRYRFIGVLWIWTGLLLPGISKAQRNDAQHLPTEGDRLAWLKNWQAAEPFFAKANPCSARAATAETNSTLRSAEFAESCRDEVCSKPQPLLDSIPDDPLLRNDPQLRLRCVTVKGDVDLDFDTDLAARDWTEPLSIAKNLGDSAWMEWHFPGGQGSRAGCGGAFLCVGDPQRLRYAFTKGHRCCQNAVTVIAEEQDMFATPRLPSE
jgi:hypothetical protein